MLKGWHEMLRERQRADDGRGARRWVTPARQCWANGDGPWQAGGRRRVVVEVEVVPAVAVVMGVVVVVVVVVTVVARWWANGRDEIVGVVVVVVEWSWRMQGGWWRTAAEPI